MLRIVAACLVLAVASAQDWDHEMECCLGGVTYDSWRGPYQLKGIERYYTSRCCFQLSLTWVNQHQNQCGGKDCPCNMAETLCCGSCRDVFDYGFGARRCCTPKEATALPANCGGTVYSFMNEDGCGAKSSPNSQGICATGKGKK